MKMGTTIRPCNSTFGNQPKGYKNKCKRKPTLLGLIELGLQSPEYGNNPNAPRRMNGSKAVVYLHNGALLSKNK